MAREYEYLLDEMFKAKVFAAVVSQYLNHIGIDAILTVQRCCSSVTTRNGWPAFPLRFGMTWTILRRLQTFWERRAAKCVTGSVSDCMASC